MRGRQLLGSQRLRCAISTLTYFPNDVFSFPFFWSLVYSFRGRNVPKEGGFVTPRSRVRCTVHGTVGAYTNIKFHIVVFWRLNWEMINYRTRDLCMRIRVQLSFNKKDMKSIKQVENGP